MENLNLQQQRFVEEFLIDLNATQAAIRAGYSAKTARQIASTLLTNIDIESAIKKAQEARIKRTQITSDRVLQEYARIGFSNIKTFVSWKGTKITMTPSDEISEDDAACISEVSQTISDAGSTLKFKLHDKKGALDSMAKHLGITNESLTVKFDPDSARNTVRDMLTIVASARASGGTVASEVVKDGETKTDNT